MVDDDETVYFAAELDRSGADEQVDAPVTNHASIEIPADAHERASRTSGRT
jgi:hypothetical protein